MSLSKSIPVLTEKNHPDWSRKIKNGFATNGPDVGPAITRGTKPDFGYPLKAVDGLVIEDWVGPDGNTYKTPRQQTLEEARLYNDLYKEASRKEDYWRKQCSSGFGITIDSLSETIRSKLENTYKVEYEAACDTYDIISLWKLIEKVCHDASAARVPELRNEFFACEYKHLVESPDVWYNKWNERRILYENATGKPMARADIYHGLRTQLDENVWMGTDLGCLWSKQDDELPDYHELFKTLTRLDERVFKARRALAKSSAKQDARGAKRKAEEDSSKSIFYMSTENQQSTQHETQQVLPLSSDGKQVCLNCGKPGHRWRVCRNPKVKCSKCHQLGHHTKFCDAFQKSKGSTSNDTGKPGKKFQGEKGKWSKTAKRPTDTSAKLVTVEYNDCIDLRDDDGPYGDISINMVKHGRDAEGETADVVHSDLSSNDDEDRDEKATSSAKPRSKRAKVTSTDQSKTPGLKLDDFIGGRESSRRASAKIDGTESVSSQTRGRSSLEDFSKLTETKCVPLLAKRTAYDGLMYWFVTYKSIDYLYREKKVRKNSNIVYVKVGERENLVDNFDFGRFTPCQGATLPEYFTRRPKSTPPFQGSDDEDEDNNNSPLFPYESHLTAEEIGDKYQNFKDGIGVSKPTAVEKAVENISKLKASSTPLKGDKSGLKQRLTTEELLEQAVSSGLNTALEYTGRKNTMKPEEVDKARHIFRTVEKGKHWEKFPMIPAETVTGKDRLGIINTSSKYPEYFDTPENFSPDLEDWVDDIPIPNPPEDCPFYEEYKIAFNAKAEQIMCKALVELVNELVRHQEEFTDFNKLVKANKEVLRKGCQVLDCRPAIVDVVREIYPGLTEGNRETLKAMLNNKFDPLIITDPKILEHTQDMSEYLIEKSSWNKYSTSDYAVNILLNEKNIKKDKEEAKKQAEKEEKERKLQELKDKAYEQARIDEENHARNRAAAQSSSSKEVISTPTASSRPKPAPDIPVDIDSFTVRKEDFADSRVNVTLVPFVSDDVRYYALRSNRLTNTEWTEGLKVEIPNTGWLHKSLEGMEKEYENILQNKDDQSHQSSHSRSMITTPVMVLCLPHLALKKLMEEGKTITVIPPAVLPAEPVIERDVKMIKAICTITEGNTPYKRTWKKFPSPQQIQREIDLVVNGKIGHFEEYLLVDSGAGVHIEKSVNALRGFTKRLKPRLKLSQADGSKLHVTCEGKIDCLGWVAVCPGISECLVSVPQLTNMGYDVLFLSDKVIITCKTTGESVEGIKSPRDSYMITRSALRSLQEKVSMVMAVTNTVTTTEQGNIEGQENSDSEGEASEENSSEESDDDSVPDLIGSSSDELSSEEVRRANELRYMHNCIGHPSDDMLSHMLDKNLIPGITLNHRDVANANKLLGPCLICQAGKSRQRSRYLALEKVPAGAIGEKVYVDIHPLQEKSVGGYMFMLISLDKYSGMMHAIKLKSKKLNSLKNAFIILLAKYKQYKHRIKEIHSDAENGFKSLASPWMEKRKITMWIAPPGEHNRPIERYIGTLKQRVLCLQAQSVITLPGNLEGATVMAAVYYLNEYCTKRFPNTTPRFMFEGRKLDLNFRTLFPFGTVGMVTNFDSTTDAVKTKLAIILGPTEKTYSSYEVYISSSNNIVSRGDKDIVPLKVLPDNLPWAPKSGAKLFTAPLKPVNRRKKPAVRLGTNVHQANAANQLLTTVSTPLVESDREGELSESNNSEVVLGKKAKKRSKANKEQSNKNKLSKGHDSNKRRKVPEEESSGTPPSNSSEDESDGIIDDEQFKSNIEKNSARSQSGMDKTKETENTLEDTSLGNLAEPAENSDSMSVNAKEQTQGKKTKVCNNNPSKRNSEVVDANKTHLSRKQRMAQKIVLNNNPEPIQTRSGRKITPKVYNEYEVPPNSRGKYIRRIYNISVTSALKGERAQETREAVRDEIQNMLTYQVGHYVRWKDIPIEKRKNIIMCFMFIKHKTKPTGEYDKTKARMVANGANQGEHMYDLVSSATVALSSVFMLFNIGSFYECIIATFDIKGAFLHAKVKDSDEVIYIKIPKEVADLWVEMDPSAREFQSDNGSLLLELERFIYGLKQSSLKFQELLNEVLTEIGYERLTQDRCLFRKLVGDTFSLLSTHVDDILQITNSDELFEELKDGLIVRFGAELTVSKEATSYLGMNIERSSCKKYVKLTQRGLTDKVVQSVAKRSGDKQKYWSPCSNEIFETDQGTDGEKLPEIQRREFLSVLMTLMYLARLTRPDILMAVTYLSSRAHCATVGDMSQLERVVRYLENFPERGIFIHCTDLAMHCHCDASFGIHSLENGGKGHTGYIVSMGGEHSYLHARSVKQKIATTSSTEAEAVALVEAMKMCTWLRNVLTELKVTPLSPITVYEDNKSCITLVKESNGPTNNSRHFIARISYLHNLVLTGVLVILYLATGLMTADVLTKPQHGKEFLKHIHSMMGLQHERHFPKADVKP